MQIYRHLYDLQAKWESASKRMEIKHMIAEMKKVNPYVETNVPQYRERKSGHRCGI